MKLPLATDYEFIDKTMFCYALSI